MAFENNITGYRSGSQYLDTSSSAGDILGTLAGSALVGTAGNVIGNAVNYQFNKKLQDNQLANQKALQDRAFKYNQVAVQQQPELMALGMQNAGLSSAQVNGAGAPSIQAGAAAGGTSAMANVFSGIADLIAAVKAPTEIEKAVAETGLASAGVEKTSAETSQMIPAQVSNLLAQTGKLEEDIRSAKNMNDVYESQLRFMKEQGSSIFDAYRTYLQSAGVFSKLPFKTQSTIDRLADGVIDVGQGEIQALRQIVDNQANMLGKDREMFDSVIGVVTAMNQLQDKSIMDAIARLPLNQQNLMKAEITEYYALAKQAKTQADLNELNKWLGEHTNDQWLIEHGLSDEIERKKYAELLNQFLNFPSAVIHSVPFIAGGAAASAGRSSPPPPVDSRGLYQYFR